MDGRHTETVDRAGRVRRNMRRPLDLNQILPAAPGATRDAQTRGRARLRVLKPVPRQTQAFGIFPDVKVKDESEMRATLQRQDEALASLRQSHEELTRKVAALQAQTDRSLLSMLQEIGGLEQKLDASKAREQLLRAENLSARKTAAREQQKLQSMATTARIQQVTSVVHSVQAAAYGQKGSLLATDNLLLAGNQLLWLFIEPLLRGAGVALGPSPSLATWLSPLGSLLTGQIVLGGRQHVRFISGVATFDGKTQVIDVPLRDRISSGFFREFRRRTDVPVTVAPLLDTATPTFAIGAVRDGVLRLQKTGLRQAGSVAWMVDTGVEGG